jgi:transposase
MSRSRTKKRAQWSARIVLACLEGKEIQQVTQEVGASIPTVSKWRGRFARNGVRGLCDRPWSGKPPVYHAAVAERMGPVCMRSGGCCAGRESIRSVSASCA